MPLPLNILLSLISWGIFSYTIFQVPYPDSLTSANLFQLTSFFIPLFLALIFTLNIFLKSLTPALILAASLIIILLLQALQILNLVTASLVILTTFLLSSHFNRKNKLKNESLRLKSPNIFFSRKIHSISALENGALLENKLPNKLKTLRLNSKAEEGTLSKLKKVNL